MQLPPVSPIQPHRGRTAESVIPPGTKRRVTYIKTEEETDTSRQSIPRSILCVVAL